eukprot:7375453-Prymnesium_polylepis.1
MSTLGGDAEGNEHLDALDSATWPARNGCLVRWPFVAGWSSPTAVCSKPAADCSWLERSCSWRWSGPVAGWSDPVAGSSGPVAGSSGP